VIKEEAEKVLRDNEEARAYAIREEKDLASAKEKAQDDERARRLKEA